MLNARSVGKYMDFLMNKKSVCMVEKFTVTTKMNNFTHNTSTRNPKFNWRRVTVVRSTWIFFLCQVSVLNNNPLWKSKKKIFYGHSNSYSIGQNSTSEITVFTCLWIVLVNRLTPYAYNHKNLYVILLMGPAYNFIESIRTSDSGAGQYNLHSLVCDDGVYTFTVHSTMFRAVAAAVYVVDRTIHFGLCDCKIGKLFVILTGNCDAIFKGKLYFWSLHSHKKMQAA